MHGRALPLALVLAACGVSVAGCTTPVAEPAAPPSSQPTVELQAPSRVEPTFGSGSGIVQRPSRAVLRDPRGDVYRVVRTPRSQTRLRVPTLDVTRATVSHLRQRVSIVVSLAEASSLAGTDLDLDLRTPAGRYFLTVALPAGPSRFVTPTADGLRCRGAGTTVDRAAGAVRITVPRSCLDDPDWVSVRVLLSRTTRTGELVENPHNSRSFSAYGTERLYPY